MKTSFSIITVNLNNKRGLRSTIKSVINQSVSNYQFIVVDGKSSDGSIDVIAEFASNIDFHISEADTGVYNAMNKGILNSTGEYLLFLNSGDHFTDNDSLKRVIDYLGAHDLVYTKTHIIGGTHPFDRAYPEHLDFSFFTTLPHSLPHPSTFIKRSLFNKYGLYDESMRISSDWKFFILAVCRYNCSYLYVPKVLSTFYIEGMSSLESNLPVIIEERDSTIGEYFPAFVNDRNELQQLRLKNKELGKKVAYVNDSRLIGALRKLGFLKALFND